jgi:hypothetical protein
MQRWQGIIYLWRALWPTPVIVGDIVLALLDLFHQDLFNNIGGVIIRVLMYLFSLLFVHKLRGERKNKEIKEEKDLKGTLKL